MAIEVTTHKSRLPTQNNGVIYRNLTTLLQINTNIKERIFDTDYYVEGYATTFNQPYVLYEELNGGKVYEIVEKAALENADMQDVILQFNHRGRIFARQSNNTLALIIDEKGLKVAADLSKTDLAKSLYQDIKEKMITKMSWGFTTTTDGYSYNLSKNMYVVSEVKKVYDVSAVDFPADEDTEIEARRKEILLNNNKERHIKIIDMLARI